jgi:hypothetical protein
MKRNVFTYGVAVALVVATTCSLHAAPEQSAALSRSITLQRSGCIGSCPNYTVTATPDGNVVFKGHAHVLATNARHRVDRTVYNNIAVTLERANFRSLQSSYVSQHDGCTSVAVGQPGMKITFVKAGRSKTVEFNEGCVGPAADAVRPVIERLARIIDRQLDTPQWIGKSETAGL